jgi:hypothetical protein
MEREQFQKAYGKIVAKAWADEGFKQRLLSQPTTVLKENGIDVPPGVEFNVVESTSNLVHLILPAKPDSPDVAVEDLDGRVAAASWCPVSAGNIG